MSRTPSVRGLGASIVLAVALLTVGGVLVYRPTLVLETSPELEQAIAALDPGVIVVLVLLGVLAFTLILSIAGRLRESTTAPLREQGRSETAGDARSRSLEETGGPIGHSFERDITLATAYDGQSQDVREEARTRLVESIRPVAATTYARQTGQTEAEAMTAVKAGTWTDDPRAAAFLGSDEGPSLPVLLWLVDLVNASDPFVRSLDRTIEEIDRLQSTAALEVTA